MKNKKKTPKKILPVFPTDRKEITSEKELSIALKNIKERLDFVNKTESIDCYNCQGGGCPVCSGTGYLKQSIDISQKILDVLWSLRKDDKFYFMAYGSELLQNLINNK